MAAPMKVAKVPLTLLEANLKCCELFKWINLRLYSNFNRSKSKPKNDKSLFNTNDPQTKGNSNGNKNKNKKSSLKNTHSHQQSPSASNRSQTSQGKSDHFENILTARRSEALCSVLIRTYNPALTLQKLQTYGPLEYAGFTSTQRCYILAQFKEMTDLRSLIEGSSVFTLPNQFPMQSRLICDNPHHPLTNRKRMKGAFTKQSTQQYPEDRSHNYYPRKESFDAEVLALYARKSLNEFDLRQRFFVCLLLEDMLTSFLPEARVTPYGSCLNGFGWWDGDLDMMLSFQPFSQEDTTKDLVDSTDQTPFKFLTEIFSTERQLSQRSLSAMAGIIELMPRISRVIKILNARVPIIRFKHDAIDLQCDLSLQALDSIKMTEILYLLSTADPRIRPLMTTIKQWALHHKVTSGGERQKPTTLGLLCLLIFYLQTCQPAVLPSLRNLQSLADSGNRGFEIEGVHYNLPASPSSIPPSSNTQSIEMLLHGFFEFFSTFNFESHAISLIEGSTFSIPTKDSPLYVENPLCIGLNICRNVTQSSLDELQQVMKQSALTMNEMARRSRPSKSPCGTTVLSRLNILFERPLVDDAVHLNIESLFSVDGDSDSVKEKESNSEHEGDGESVKEEEMKEGSEKDGLLVEVKAKDEKDVSKVVL